MTDSLNDHIRCEAKKFVDAALNRFPERVRTAALEALREKELQIRVFADPKTKACLVELVATDGSAIGLGGFDFSIEDTVNGRDKPI